MCFDRQSDCDGVPWHLVMLQIAALTDSTCSARLVAKTTAALASTQRACHVDALAFGWPALASRLRLSPFENRNAHDVREDLRSKVTAFVNETPAPEDMTFAREALIRLYFTEPRTFAFGPKFDLFKDGRQFFRLQRHRSSFTFRGS